MNTGCTKNLLMLLSTQRRVILILCNSSFGLTASNEQFGLLLLKEKKMRNAKTGNRNSFGIEKDIRLMKMETHCMLMYCRNFTCLDFNR